MVIGGQDDLLNKSPIGQVVEILGLVPVSELGALQTDGTLNLRRFFIFAAIPDVI